MNNQSVRDIFDQISHSVISFLENHSGVTDVEFMERQGVVEALLNAWEDEFTPYILPHDFKSFLQISDGLLLEWKIRMHSTVHPLGQMHVNRLRDIKPFNITDFTLRKLGDEYDSEEEEAKSIRAFDLDKLVKNGRLALLY